jgi:ribosome-associated protein
MLDALADSVLEKVRETHRLKGRSEGHASAGWVVVDYGSVTVHLFAPEIRDFYRLEDLWREGKILLHLQ